ncbi:MAG: arsenate reductase family protein [Bifidobacterium mongoliense]|jgi:arsenate reductase|uniref:arsenate reductase family protein n=1 Tax=Bifidobacterium mongoliense TaxID=518643 RepID=UPI002F358E37
MTKTANDMTDMTGTLDMTGAKTATANDTAAKATTGRTRATSASVGGSPAEAGQPTEATRHGDGITFICYSRCSTCAKARRWLDEHRVSYTSRDIVTDRPNVRELTSWFHASGLPLRRMFNTSGQRYRALGLKDRLGSMSEDEALTLLASDGMLVKRPLVVSAHGILVGFQPKAWGTALSSTGDALE